MHQQSEISRAGFQKSKTTIMLIIALAILTLATKSFSADCGSGEDCERIGRELDKNKEYAKSFVYYQKSCELNNAEGCFKAGAAHYHGYGVEKNPKKAEPFLLKANQLEGKGKRLLAGIYAKTAKNHETGSDGAEKSEAKAIEYYKKSVSILGGNINSLLALAIRDGHGAKVKALLALGADLNLQDKYGFTPLMEAILADRHDILTILLNNKADTIIRSNNCYDAMRLAIKRGQHESIKSLVKFGYKINQKFPRDYRGSDEKKVDCEFNDGQPLIYLVSTTNNIDVAKTLIDLGAEAKNTEQDGYLFYLAQLNLSFIDYQTNNIKILSGMLEGMKKGILADDADGLIKESKGRGDSYKMVEFLLSKGLRPNCRALAMVENQDIFDIYLKYNSNINCHYDNKSLLFRVLETASSIDGKLAAIGDYKLRRLLDTKNIDLTIKNKQPDNRGVLDGISEFEQFYKKNPDFTRLGYYPRFVKAAELYREALSTRKSLK